VRFPLTDVLKSTGPGERQLGYQPARHGQAGLHVLVLLEGADVIGHNSPLYASRIFAQVSIPKVRIARPRNLIVLVTAFPRFAMNPAKLSSSIVTARLAACGAPQTS
jgi:hypothetical protein